MVIQLLLSLGFIINLKKSALSDAGAGIFRIHPKLKKDDHLATLLSQIAHVEKIGQKVRDQETTIQEVAQIIAMMVAAHPAILPAPLHYRQLEIAKLTAQTNGKSYESKMRVTPSMKTDLNWWIHYATSHNGRCLQVTHWDLTIESDTSTKGWGASCEGKNTGGPWTSHETLSHQLLGAAYGIFSPEVICLTSEIYHDSASLGQCHSNCISQQAGGYTMLITVEPSTGDLELVHWQEDYHTCGAPSRKIRCQSGLGITTHNRFHWLDAPLGDFSSAADQEGPIHNRLVCLKDQFPASCILQLEARPRGLGSGCIIDLLEDHYLYVFPPFALVPRCLHKIEKEKVTSLLVAPVWSNQPWFPLFLKFLIDFPILLPPIPDTVTNPHSLNHPLAIKGHLPLAAWPVSGSPTYRSEGFSDGVISIIQQSWGSLTESAYSSAWWQWDSCCLTRNIVLLSAPLSSILEFLLEQFNMGKQYCMINTLCSAISMIDSCGPWCMGNSWSTPHGILIFEGSFQQSPTSSEIFL